MKLRGKRDLVHAGRQSVGQGFGHADGCAFNVTEAARPAACEGGRVAERLFKGAMREAAAFGGFLFLRLLPATRDASPAYLLGVVAVATDVYAELPLALYALTRK